MVYSIAEVAEKYGVAPHTLRYYDKEGLMPFVERNSAGVRVFKENDFVWLDIIHCLKKSGVPIRQIKEYLEWCQQGDPTLQTRHEFMINHKQKIQKQIDEINKHMELIDYKIWYYETAIEAGTTEIHKKKATGNCTVL
jgi:Predicted transcriptional regulators